MPSLKLVGDLLGVVEALGDDEMDADVVGAPIAPGNRSKHARRPPAWLVVGEDVIDFVAAAATGQAAHVRTLAVAILQLRLRLGLRRIVVVPLLGEAEIDERTMPCVAEGHG